MDQSPPQQILLGKHLPALHHHNGLAVHARVKVLQAPSLLVFVHLAVHRSDHLLHQPDRLHQVVIIVLTPCV